MEQRLRISHIIVQPVLMWDNGEELHPGPTIQPLHLPLSELPEFTANLPTQVAEVAAELAKQSPL